MPMVKQKVEDSWYVNKTDAPLSLGAALVLKPGEERFIPGSFVAQSRATYQALTKALKNGTLARKGEEAKKPEPKKVEVVEEVKVADSVVVEPEPEDDLDTEIDDDGDDDESPAKKAIRRRKSKKTS